MDEFKEEIKNFISARKINLTEEKELISLFEYYNVLLTRKALEEEGK